MQQICSVTYFYECDDCKLLVTWTTTCVPMFDSSGVKNLWILRDNVVNIAPADVSLLRQVINNHCTGCAVKQIRVFHNEWFNWRYLHTSSVKCHTTQLQCYESILFAVLETCENWPGLVNNFTMSATPVKFPGTALLSGFQSSLGALKSTKYLVNNSLFRIKDP